MVRRSRWRPRRSCSCAATPDPAAARLEQAREGAAHVAGDVEQRVRHRCRRRSSRRRTARRRPPPRAARGRRPRATSPATGLTRRGGMRRQLDLVAAHPHHRDHAQVVREREHRPDHDRDAEPGVVARHGRVDQIELADEAARWPGSRPARASRSSSATPARARSCRGSRTSAGRRRARTRARARPPPRTPPRSSAGRRRGRRPSPAAPSWRADHDAGQQVAGLRDARPGEHPLERALRDRADVADHDRHGREHGERRRPVELRRARARWSNSRRKTANAAALVATAMNVVIGVGAPW